MKDATTFVNWLQKRLLEQLPGYAAHEKMIHKFRDTPYPFPANARQSAVLMALYLDKSSTLHIVMIERAKRDGSPHSGQIALPGGKVEPEDTSLWNTALRESEEEINLKPNDVIKIGALSPIYIPVSNFVVHPFVGFLEELPILTPSDDEVHKILYLNIDDLIQNQINVSVSVPAAPGGIIETQAYGINEHQYVWGATAMMFAELEAVYEEYKSLYSNDYSI